MPRVSRKLVTNPIATSADEGRSRKWRRLAVQIHTAIDATFSSTNATYSNTRAPAMPHSLSRSSMNEVYAPLAGLAGESLAPLRGCGRRSRHLVECGSQDTDRRHAPRG